ncbi:putative fatty acid synthase [Heterostelium album PN500]|uniref:Putative fatty acid synthase n=1 Tax=Heterostelium pallidum (strain ATCC 26659 / Pp 5 / PN500) TaxID=670386 RepID=D3B3H8_HETP5|nr:putative fatty acid synthase [Heterostelium album PN500]EFA83876.1 putative fatty acid synthase [Heterostelium album PN500]|eukprot:XP_020435993.1 putative fatty acid synthase [Heterostelium album PN500]
MTIYLGRTPPTNPKFEIIYKSDKYVVVNKPYDICIDGDDREFTVKKYIESCYQEVKGEVRFVNRIDYATSGIVLTATTKSDANVAGQLFQNRATKKHYLALVWGHLHPLYDTNEPDTTEITVDKPIADDKTDVNAFKMCIGVAGTDNPGRPSTTHVRVLQHGYYNGRPVSKVHLIPHTGRRHQLRVHLDTLGHVIVGDETYGPKDAQCFRMMLHSWKLTIPFKNETLNFETEDPFKDLLSLTLEESIQKQQQQTDENEEKEKEKVVTLTDSQKIDNNNDNKEDNNNNNNESVTTTTAAESTTNNTETATVTTSHKNKCECNETIDNESHKRYAKVTAKSNKRVRVRALNNNKNIVKMSEQQEQSSTSQDVAVIGMGLRFPGGSKNPNEFWEHMVNRFDGISKTADTRWAQSFYDQDFISNEFGGYISEEEWKRFDPLFFGVLPKEAIHLDPQQRVLMTILWEALEDAQIQPAKIRGSNTGVFIGLMNLDYQKQGFREITDMSPYLLTGNGNSFISNRLSFAFDFRGPSMTLDTACSSSLNAVYLGVQAIQTGDCEMAVVGGVNALYDPTISIAFTNFGMLSHKGKCRSFDASADGFVRAEGAGLCVLKSYDAAIRDGDRIYCVIKGGSSNVDGYNKKNTITAPSMHAQSENIELALKKSNLQPEDIYYIESHGTGTPVGDPIEVEALSLVFADNHTKNNPLKIGSVKSNMGHLESAAGIASLIKVCLMLKNRQLIPNIHFERVNPKIKLDEWNVQVVTEQEQFPEDKVVRMGVNSFGLSGSNCHIICEEVKSNLTKKPTLFLVLLIKIFQKQKNNNVNQIEKEYLVPVSANSKLSLDKYMEEIKNNQSKFVESIPFEDFVQHQILARSHLYASRRVVVARNWQDFIEQKTAYSTSSTLSSNIAALGLEQKTPIVFVFCGQGPQWKAMGKVLYAAEPVFREAVDRCDALLTKLFGYSILAALDKLESESSPEIHEPKLAQPSVFLIQVGLVALYAHWNIKPTIVVGHSFGEVTAALAANILSLETAANIVYHRSTLQNLTIGSGRMMSIGIGADQYVRDYASLYPTIEIACYNSLDSIVITGAESTLKEVANKLKESGIFTAFLTTPCSFHSSHQEKIKQQVFDSPLANLQYNDGPMLPFFSTIHGGQLHSKEEYNTQYIYDNLRQPVEFTKAIDNIFGYIQSNQLGTSPIFIEVGPHPTLQFYIKKLVPAPQSDEHAFTPLILSPLHKKKNDIEVMQSTLAAIYNHGINIDFASQFNNQNNAWKELTHILPRYQWDTEEYWHEPLISQKVRLEGPSSTILGNKVNTGGLLYQTVINVTLDSFNFLKGHKIKGKYLFPGSGYIDNILNIFKGQDVSIHNLEFNIPFFLTDGVQHHLQSNVVQNSKNEYKVEFNFKENHQTDKWIKSAHGRVSTYQPLQPAAVPKANLDQLRQRCNLATLSKDEVYTKLQTLGLPYGPTFQRIESFSFGTNCSFATLQLQPPTSRFDTGSFFNASILDCALHGLLALMDGPQEIVFERLEHFKLYSANLPAVRPTHVYLFNKVIKEAGNTSQGSVEMFLEDGTIIASFGKIVSNSLIKVKRTSTIKVPAKETYSQVWQPKEAVLATPVISQPSATAECTIDLELDSNFRDFVGQLIYTNVFNSQPVLDQSLDQLFTQFNVDDKNKNLFARLFDLVKDVNVQSNVSETKQALLTKQGESYSRDIELVERSLIQVIPSILNASDAASTDSIINQQDDAGFTSVEHIQYNSKLSQEAIASLVSLVESSIASIPTATKNIFKILDVASQSDTKRSTTVKLLQSINNQLNNSNVVVEYTVICPSVDVKESLKSLLAPLASDNLLIKYRTTINIENDLVEQGLLVSNYHLVISHYTLSSSAVSIKTIVNNLTQVLTPSGQLALIEAPRSSVVFDLVAGINVEKYYNNFQQDETRSANNHCAISNNELSQLLSSVGLLNSTSTLTLPHQSYLTVAQKPSIQQSTSTSTPIDKIVFVVAGTEYDETFTQQGLLNANKIEIIKSSDILDQSNNQDQLLSQVNDGKNNYIFFLAGLESLTIENYKIRTMEFVKLNQILLKNQVTNVKTVLTTLNAQRESSNYLNTSLVGIYRYFLEFQSTLQTVAIDLDVESASKVDLSYLIKLSNTATLGDKEFLLRNNKPLVQRVFLEPTLLTSPSSYENNTDKLCCKLNSNLQFVFHPRDQLLPEQVEIQVKATGINYKDNLFYRGLLPQEIFSKGDIYNPPFGLECAGIISRVGSASHFKVGDEVVGFASHSFSSHVITHQDRIVIKPKSISFVEAAAIPVVYATAYYAIFHIGRFIPSKDSILVHSSTGGVGIAALNLLKYKQHTGPVFATIGGSKEKREYLEKRYGSLITSIISTANNSVAGGYPDAIRQFPETREGVDIILNTLSGDFLKPNFDALSPIGRIMDLSVTQLMENDNIDIEVFKYHVGYQTIDLERAIAYSPKVVNGILREVFQAIDQGQLDSIPVESFPVKETKKAIEYINERKHIGKLVVDFEKFDQDVLAPLLQDVADQKVAAILKPNYTIDGLDSTLLITGQTGIAVCILRWILQHAPANLKNVIVLSRSQLKWELELLINQQKAANSPIQIHYRSVDVANFSNLKSTVQELYQSNPSIGPVKSVIHFATIYDYCDVESISQKTIDSTHNPKAVGAFNLHKLGLELNFAFNHFILFSSIVAVLGSTNQASYTSANFVLDGLANYRRSQGLNATAINWGGLGSAGEAAKDKSVTQFLQSRGILLLSLPKILGTLNGIFNAELSQQSTQVMASSYTYKSLFDYCPQIRPKMEHLAADEDLEKKQSTSNSSAGGNSVFDRVVAQISELLSIHPSKLNYDTRLKDYGIDSLLTVQLKNWIDQEFQKNLFTHLQLSSNSINSIIQKISAKTPTATAAATTATATSANKEVQLSTSKPGTKPIEFWKKELELDQDITPSATLKPAIAITNDAPINVFLTGVTGYLGIYLLSDYLNKPNVQKIYCLVRAKASIEEARQSVFNKLNQYRLTCDVAAFDQRVVLVLGDLSQPLFGLQHAEFTKLANSVDLIVSNGANVNFIEFYDEIRLTNINGTKDIIRLAITGDTLKRIIHVSSISVFFNDNRNESITEDVYPTLNHINDMNGYIQSKVVTEYLIKEASARGIPSQIVRVGPIFGDSTTGIDNENDILGLVVKSIFELRSYPAFNQQLGEGNINTSPIDWVSKSFVGLTLHGQYWSNQLQPTVYHLINQDEKRQMKNLTDICNIINQQYPLTVEPDFLQWKEKLMTSNSTPCKKIRGFFRTAKTFPLFHIGFGDCKRTMEHLNHLGIPPCEITTETIIKNIEYYQTTSK